MGVYIKPCRRCPLREGCEHREELKKRAIGTGARSISFDCDRLARELRPGRRVMVPMPRLKECGSRYQPDMRTVWVNVPATIVSASGYYEFSCITDPGTVQKPDEPSDDKKSERFRFRRRMAHHRIRGLLDEPDREFCNLGSLLLPGGGCDRPPDEVCACKEWGDFDVLESVVEGDR